MSKLSEVLQAMKAENAAGKDYSIGKFDCYVIELFLNGLMDGVIQGQGEGEGDGPAEKNLTGILPEKLLKAIDKEEDPIKKTIELVSWLEWTLGLATMWNKEYYTQADVEARWKESAKLNQTDDWEVWTILNDIVISARATIEKAEAWAEYMDREAPGEEEEEDAAKDMAAKKNKDEIPGTTEIK